MSSDLYFYWTPLALNAHPIRLIEMTSFVQRGSKAVGRVLLLTSALAMFTPWITYTVPPGHRAVIFDRLKGVHPETYKEGIHLMIPWVHVPHILDVRTTPTDIPTMTGAKDLQQVSVNLRLLSRPSLSRLPQIWNELGENYNDRVLPSVSNEVLKAVVAQYNAEQLITQRDAISREVREALAIRTETFGIILDDVSLVHVTFSPDFAKAIEEKQVAEQTAERAKYVVDRAEQERLAVVTRAEGDAEAAIIISKALDRAGNGLIELRRIETALAVAQVLSDKSNVTYLPSDANPLLMMPPPSGAGKKQQQATV